MTIVATSETNNAYFDLLVGENVNLTTYNISKKSDSNSDAPIAISWCDPEGSQATTFGHLNYNPKVIDTLIIHDGDNEYNVQK